jgi:hypothetical protein
MATIASLVFSLKAEAAQFQKTFDKADKVVRDFQRNAISKFVGGAALVKGLEAIRKPV